MSVVSRLRMSLCVAAALGACGVSSALELGENFLIPIYSPVDNVFDVRRGTLYISQATTTEVLRYDVGNQGWLAPLTLNTNPRRVNALDITPDGNWLYATTNDNGILDYSAYLAKIDLNTSVDHGFLYSTGYDEGEGYDVTTVADGKAFLTSYRASYLREVDVATDVVTKRLDAPGTFPGGMVTDRTGLFTSGDRETMLVWQGNTTLGPAFVYDAASNTFGPVRNLNTLWHAGASVNRDGTLISTPVALNPMGPLYIRDRALNVVRQQGVSSGAQFDPVRDRLYVLDTIADQIIGYDTNNWSELFRFPVGEPINLGEYLREGYMTVSADGQYLFMNTDSGIRVYGIPEPASASLLMVATLLTTARRKRTGTRFSVAAVLAPRAGL